MKRSVISINVRSRRIRILLKKTNQDELEKAILTVLADGNYYPKNLSAVLKSSSCHNQQKNRREPDHREQEVLELICKECPILKFQNI